MICFFANILIDNNERYLRFCDAIKSIPLNIFSSKIVNIRGSYKIKCFDFISNLNFKTYSIESGFGWLFDSSKLISSVNEKYIFIFQEDHLCMNKNYFYQILKNLYDLEIDIFYYAYWENGEYLKAFKHVYLTESQYIFSFHKDNKNCSLISHYSICLPSIIKKTLFLRVCNLNEKSIWPIEAPFSFEKDTFHQKLLPLKIGLLKKELFASIDDERIPGTKQDLISRGMYPKRIKVKRLSYNNTYLTGKRNRLNIFLKVISNKYFYYNLYLILKLYISFGLNIKIFFNEKNKFNFFPNIKTINYLLKLETNKKFLIFPGVSNEFRYLLKYRFSVVDQLNFSLEISHNDLDNLGGFYNGYSYRTYLSNLKKINKYDVVIFDKLNSEKIFKNILREYSKNKIFIIPKSETLILNIKKYPKIKFKILSSLSNNFSSLRSDIIIY